MPTQLKPETDTPKTTEKTRFLVEGLALLETVETMPEDLKLTAYAFDPAGHLLGSSPLDAKGRFSVPLHLGRPADVQLLIGPAGEPETMLKSSIYKKIFSAKDWTVEGSGYRLNPRIFVNAGLWKTWYPKRIFVSGHIRNTQGMPIPYAKVEIFDVDREPFLWPYLVARKDFLAKRKAIRMSDLMQETAFEKAGPLPEVSINPQPEPPGMDLPANSRVGEMAKAAPALAEMLEGLTVTSTAAPWMRFPKHFYSRKLVRTAHTDYQGLFHTSFKWWPIHLRRGRLRLDPLPDIILRVTQVIDGVERVLYMDPYSSTRWGVNCTHIDLYLDYPEIQAGSGTSPVPPPGMETFFTRIGNDEVFHIDQTTGRAKGLFALPHTSTAVSCTNIAYGDVLRIHGQLGKKLCGGTKKYYYRLSYGKKPSKENEKVTFTPVTKPLTDTRVNRTTLKGETYSLGPKTITDDTGKVVGTALYEVRDLDHYFWYNPDWLGRWDTRLASDGTYMLKLEVFDENAEAMAVEYLDGTADPTDPPTKLPSMKECTLVVAVQNQAPVVNLEITGVGPSGIIPWKENLSLNLKLTVSQPNGLLSSWGLHYAKGLESAQQDVKDQNGKVVCGSYPNGISTVITSLPVPVSSMGITSSYALALKLWAWAHIRNGDGFIYYNEEINATAVVKCPLT